MASKPIGLQSRITYPREAAAGSTYLVSVDLDHALPPDEWPYDDEEYPVTCFLDATPYFDQEPDGDATIIVHRYGGSYGPARFWLTARPPPEQSTDGRVYQPQIRVVLVNGAGIPIHTWVLDDIKVVAKVRGSKYLPVPTEDVLIAAIRRVRNVDSVIEKVPTFRWLHLADLQFRNDASQTHPDVGRTATEFLAESGGSIDAVIVSGDIAWSGLPEEFDRAGLFLRQVRETIARAQPSMPPLIVVPGNHDMTQITAQSPVSAGWTRHSPQRSAFWSSGSAREGIVQGFAHFAAWSMRAEALGANNRGLLPGDVAVTLQVDGMKVGIVGLNDSILASPYRGVRADLHTEQLRAVCGDIDVWADSHDLRILVTHHSPESLLPELRESFYRDFAPRSRFDLHLFGSTKVAKDGIQTIRNGRARSAAINAARLVGKGTQDMRICEASVRHDDVSIRLWRFAGERGGSMLKQGRVDKAALGRRPTHDISLQPATTPASASSAPSIVTTRPLVSSEPVGKRLATFVGIDHLDVKTAKKHPRNALVEAFISADYGDVTQFDETSMREDILNQLRGSFERSAPADLVVFVFSAFTPPIDDEATIVANHSAELDWWQLTRADVFDIAREAQRRLLVIGDLPGDTEVPAGCGIIGNLYFREPKRTKSRAFMAVTDTLRSASTLPTTVQAFAAAVERTMLTLGRGMLILLPQAELSEEMAKLQIAGASGPGTRLRKRQESVGFDTEFLPQFSVPLPNVVAPGAYDGPLINHDHFSLAMNPTRRMARFAAVNVDLQLRIDSDAELDWEQWRYEPEVPRSHQLSDDIFKNSPFDRSRIVKKMQPAWGTTAQARRAFAATGTFANLMPLVGAANRNPLWVALPDYVAEHHAKDMRLSMIAGPMFAPDDPEFRGIQVPAACWRILALVTREGLSRAAAFLTYQTASAGSFLRRMPRFPRRLPRSTLVTRVPIRLLGALTQLDFGSLVEHDVGAFGASLIESSATPGIPVTSLETAFPLDRGPHFAA